MSRRRRATALLLLASAAFALVVRAHEGHQHSNIEAKGIRTDDEGRLVIEAPARRALGLATAEIDFGALEEAATVPARVVVPWSRQAFASTRLAGVVREVRVRPGQPVAAGEVLAVVESLPLVALHQQLVQTRIELDLAEENLRRVGDLGESIVAGREILSLQAQRDERRSAVRTLERKLSLVAPVSTATIAVRSPLGGVVSDVDVVLGQLVESEEHLFHVSDLSEVWVELEVPEVFAGRVGRGQAVRISFSALPGRAFEGEVGFVELTLDMGRHVRRAYVPLENVSGELLPEMFGTGQLVLRALPDAFVAPTDAIVTDGAEPYALVQEEEGLYRKQGLVLGLRQGRRVEVQEGLYPGDVVVTQGNHELAALFVRGTLKLSESARRTIALELAEVDLRRVDRVLTANARVIAPPDRRGVATTRMEGKVDRFHVTLGQEVSAGQPIAEVSSLDLQTVQLDMLQRAIQLGLTERQLELVESLAGQGVTARKELIRLRSEAAALRSELEALRRQLVVMGLAEEEVDAVLATSEVRSSVTVRAPVTGRVNRVLTVLGQVVHGGDPVVELLDSSRVWVEGAVFEPDLAALLRPPLEKPVRVTVVAHGDRAWQGRVSFTNRALTAQRTLPLWVELDNPDALLLPGMQARLTVVIDTPAERVIAAPSRALLRIGRKDFAFVEKTDAFRRVEVRVGRLDAEYVEILEGLFPGDRVAVNGVNELNNALSALR